MESKVNTQRLICFKVTGCEIESTLIAHDLFISSVLDLYRLTYMYFQLSDCTCSLYEQLLVRATSEASKKDDAKPLKRENSAVSMSDYFLSVTND
jgi:ribosomal protein S26